MEEKWQTPGVELPPLEEWWKLFRFPEKRKRKTLCNKETAEKMAEVLVPEGSKGKVIIEAWPGALCGSIERVVDAERSTRVSRSRCTDEGITGSSKRTY